MYNSTTVCSSDPARLSSPICPVVLTKVPDLKEISAVNVAIGLWNHVNISKVLWRSGSTSYSLSLSSVTPSVKRLTSELPVPKSVADYINTYVVKISYQTQDWVAYHRQVIFFGDGRDFHLYYHFSYFAWYPDGTINYKGTALNLLSSLRLSEVEKYKFLCTYCIEDELTKLVPLLLMDNIVELVDFNSHPLIHYWNHYFRNELHAIRFQANLSLDNYMFQHHRVNNWWAKEYFFDRLNSEEKVQGAITLINQFGVWYQKLILMKMNECERANVYTQKAVQIMSNYSKTGICTREILSTWYDIRDLIDVDQFVLIFNNLLGSRNADTILADIWVSACDSFKRHISTCNNYQMIGTIFQILQMQNIDTDNQFLFAVLSDFDVEVRKSITKMRFFIDYCNRLFERNKLPMLERLIRKCVPIQEVEPYRQDLILNSKTIERMCLGHYSSGHVELLNKFLAELLPSRPDLIQEYKKKLLMSPNSIERLAMAFEKTSTLLDVIIADGLPTDDLKRNFKKSIIFSSHAVSHLQSLLVQDYNRFFQVKGYVDYYLVSDEDKKTFKKRLITNFETKLASICIKGGLDMIHTVLRWCLEDNQSVLEYKSTLHIDVIFDKLLESAIFLVYNPYRLSSCTFKKQFDFTHVELFLKWYFEFISEVKLYKLRRINSYFQIPVINTLLKKKDERYLKLVMKWFFDGDQEEINKFRKKYQSAGKIIYVI